MTNDTAPATGKTDPGRRPSWADETHVDHLPGETTWCHVTNVERISPGDWGIFFTSLVQRDDTTGEVVRIPPTVEIAHPTASTAFVDLDSLDITRAIAFSELILRAAIQLRRALTAEWPAR